MKFEPKLPRDGVNVGKIHPLTEVVVGVVGLALIVLVLVTGAAVTVDWGVQRLPASWEKRLFSHDWLTATLPYTTDDPRAAALQQLVDGLASAWEDPPFAFRVAIAPSDDANAMALPGGWIVVTGGLLEAVSSENELAFVLGHELGHFRNRDHLRGLGRGVALAAASSALGWGAGSGAAQLTATLGRLGGRVFDRSQELAADAFGLTLLALHYGHVEGAEAFFRSDALADPGSGTAAYFSTHPIHEQRIGELRELAATRGYRRGEVESAEAFRGAPTRDAEVFP